MNQRTIDEIRKQFGISDDVSDGDIERRLSGSSAEARINLCLSIKDLCAAIRNSLPEWLVRR